MLDSWNTDDKLTLPPEAISKHEKYRVCYKCDTSFHDYDKHLGGAKVLSCIVVFHLHTGQQVPFTFQSAVRITVYHTALNDNDKKLLRVICIDDDDKVSEVPPCPPTMLNAVIKLVDGCSWQSVIPDATLPFYVNFEDHVDIYSNHFSRYVCCQKGHGQEYPSMLTASIYITADVISIQTKNRITVRVSMGTHNDLAMLRPVNEVHSLCFLTHTSYLFCNLMRSK